MPAQRADGVAEQAAVESSVVPSEGNSESGSSGLGDCCVRLLARRADGERSPNDDMELEIYRSGKALHLMLSRSDDDEAPLLWHGNHPVWMDASSGQRCDRPEWGLPLEALARRVRALLG